MSEEVLKIVNAIRELADGRRHYEGDELFRALGDVRDLADKAIAILAPAAPAAPDESSLSYTCPRCKKTSHNPNDALHRYCAACDAFHADAITRTRVENRLRAREAVKARDCPACHARAGQFCKTQKSGDPFGQTHMERIKDEDKPCLEFKKGK